MDRFGGSLGIDEAQSLGLRNEVGLASNGLDSFRAALVLHPFCGAFAAEDLRAELLD